MLKFLRTCQQGRSCGCSVSFGPKGQQSQRATSRITGDSGGGEAYPLLEAQTQVAKRALESGFLTLLRLDLSSVGAPREAAELKPWSGMEASPNPLGPADHIPEALDTGLACYFYSHHLLLGPWVLNDQGPSFPGSCQFPSYLSPAPPYPSPPHPLAPQFPPSTCRPQEMSMWLGPRLF